MMATVSEATQNSSASAMNSSSNINSASDPAISSRSTESDNKINNNHCNSTPAENSTLENHSATTNATLQNTASAATDTASHVNKDAKEEIYLRNIGSDVPLPADLKRILSEVALTGDCSWLSWSAEGGQKAPNEAASAANPCQGRHYASFGGTNHTSSNTTKYALGMAIPRGQSSSNRRPYNRLSSSSPHYPTKSRKKHRNGIKQVNRRRLEATAAGGSTTTSTQTSTVAAASTAGNNSGRKRPLFLLRASAAGGGVFSPSSVGSGRTSVSEPDDSTQYECDSEGTSATSCSELSTERRTDHQLRNMQRVAVPAAKLPATTTTDELASSHEYRSLKDVFWTALGLVLDHWYQHKGGYKLSPAEKRKSENVNPDKAQTAITSSHTSMNGEIKPNDSTVNGNANNNPGKTSENSSQQQNQQSTTTDKSIQAASKAISCTPERIFQQRRHRLMMMFGQPNDKARFTTNGNKQFQAYDDGPPFTIQRIAEVLIAPERYYTQTHKLCNCLEKLLLVTTSTSAFGGGTGGVTSQSRKEERELAALADERGRLETEFRQRALKRRYSSILEDLQGDVGARSPGSPSREFGYAADANHKEDNSPEKNEENDGFESSSREMLEAAARSLRPKFDHVGIDPHHSSAVASRDVRSIAENRCMTNSPPPPSLAMSAAAASNIALPGHGHAGVGNFVGQHMPEQNSEHPGIARVPSPILFSEGNESSGMPPLNAAPNNMHGMLHHMHHSPPSLGGGVSMNSTPFDVVTIEGASAPNAAGLSGSNEGADLEGRSSASNSDIDSESDDVSFDDSASDRSDGSDTGPGLYEPFTAARAMALNRIQQQQRLQSRVLTSQALHQSEGGGFRSADSEYQSGDSIDSTRGEDSGGSDSSSSDMAD